jgi:hypothetical protein
MTHKLPRGECHARDGRYSTKSNGVAFDLIHSILVEKEMPAALWFSVFYMLKYTLDMLGRLSKSHHRFLQLFVKAFSHILIHTRTMPMPRNLDHEQYADNSHRPHPGYYQTFL